MSKKAVHVAVGAVTGAGAAALVANRNNENAFELVLQVLGGFAGGWHGGALPDVLEPALTPVHRGAAHSLAMFAGGTTAAVKKGHPFLSETRARVRALEAARDLEVEPWRRFWLTIAVALAHVGLGYAVGISVGYGSHLALDACTPRSLPLLGR